MHLACSVGVGRSQADGQAGLEGGQAPGLPIGHRARARGRRVPADAELAFLHPLPVRALWGVGPVTEPTARWRSASRTVGELAAAARMAPAERTSGVAQRAATCRSCPGASTTDRSCPSRRPSRSATRRRSRPTSGTATTSTAASCGWSTPRPTALRALGSGRPDRHRQAAVRGLLQITRSHTLATAGRRHPGHRRGGDGPAGVGRPWTGRPPARCEPVRLRASRTWGTQLSLDLDVDRDRAPSGDGRRRGRSTRGGPGSGATGWRRAQEEAERIQESWGTVTAAVDAIRARYGGSSVGRPPWSAGRAAGPAVGARPNGVLAGARWTAAGNGERNDPPTL